MISPVRIDANGQTRADCAGMMNEGNRVDHVTSAFATKVYQLDNALRTSLDGGGRHWSYALPEVMKDSKLELGEEARGIEASFVR